MIETDEKGNAQLEILVNEGLIDFTEWEQNFIKSIRYKLYQQLTPKQKTTVSNIWEKYFK